MESNNFGSTFTLDDIKKKVKKTLIFSLSLIFGGIIIAIVLAFSFVGEDGFIRDDAPSEWLFVSLIPIILGFIMLIVPVISIKKLAKSNRQFGTLPELSPEQLEQWTEEMLNPIKKFKIFTIIVAVLFFGVLFVLTLLGELDWSEFFDILF